MAQDEEGKPGLAGYKDFNRKDHEENDIFRKAGYWEEGQWVPTGALFSSLERQRLIFHILEDQKQQRGADLGIAAASYTNVSLTPGPWLLSRY